MEMKLQLSPPWVTFYKEMRALFAHDKGVCVLFDQEEMEISVYVENQGKAEALAQLLPDEKEFGNVTVRIRIVPGNREGVQQQGLWETAFEGNEAYCYTSTIDSPIGALTYVVWTHDVVQFFNDNLADKWGNRTMLFEDVARDVLTRGPAVYHCTIPVLPDITAYWP